MHRHVLFERRSVIEYLRTGVQMALEGLDSCRATDSPSMLIRTLS